MKNKNITHANVHFVLTECASFTYVDIQMISQIASGKIETHTYFMIFLLFISYDVSASIPNTVDIAHHCPPNHPSAPRIPSHICTFVNSVEYPSASAYEIAGINDAATSTIFFILLKFFFFFRFFFEVVLVLASRGPSS